MADRIQSSRTGGSTAQHAWETTVGTRQRLRKTKVVATIGPACDSVETIKKMIGAGMNVARLNFSHDGHAEHAIRLERIRQAAHEMSANVATMLDTKGLEVRTGSVEDARVELVDGQPFTLYVVDRLGSADGVSVSHRGLVEELKVDDVLLIDDGAIELRVVSLHDHEIRCKVVRGGMLGNHKGVNVPGTEMTLEGMHEANVKDLLFAVQHEMDYIAASFVRRAADVDSIRGILQDNRAAIPIIAKIENREGVRNLDEIVAAADGTMVARGDLGVEMPLQEVPIVQKKIIRKTVMNGKPVITATQMLDSMERNSRPTRAEVSDVANAILDGTSAVMLSGETARGRYPVEAVRTMATLALEAEASLGEYGHLQQILPHPSALVTEAVSQAAITMANHLQAALIVTLTESGFTSRAISKYRPTCPILAVTISPEVERKLAMNWGVTALRYNSEPSDDRELEFAIERARQLGYVGPGDVIVATAGISREAGSTNMIRVITVRDGS